MTLTLHRFETFAQNAGYPPDPTGANRAVAISSDDDRRCAPGGA